MSIANMTFVPLGAQSQTIIHTSLDPYSAFFYSFCIICTSMMFHELGHYLIIKSRQGTKIEFLIDRGFKLRTGPINHLDKLQLKIMYFLGISFGYVPIFIGYLVHPFYILLTAPYIVGCLRDIKELMR